MSQTLHINRPGSPPGPALDGLRDAYRFLQKVVGCIALGLPLVLIAGGWLLDDHGVEGSLSAYYHTPLGGVFVGALCALGVFFLSYQHRPLDKGYRIDNWLSYVASGAALGVALFPTAEHEQAAWTVERLVSIAHVVFASVLLSTLAIFCLALFRRSSEPDRRGQAKQRRDAIYGWCGWTIVAAIAVILLNKAFEVIPSELNALLWLETIAVVAFGFSWLVKSEFVKFFNDPPTREETS